MIEFKALLEQASELATEDEESHVFDLMRRFIETHARNQKQDILKEWGELATTSKYAAAMLILAAMVAASAHNNMTKEAIQLKEKWDRLLKV